MGYYKDIPTDALERMWNEKRLHMDALNIKKELDEVYKMRMELDRRKGNVSPLRRVNFADYTTD